MRAAISVRQPLGGASPAPAACVPPDRRPIRSRHRASTVPPADSAGPPKCHPPLTPRRSLNGCRRRRRPSIAVSQDRPHHAAGQVAGRRESIGRRAVDPQPALRQSRPAGVPDAGGYAAPGPDGRQGDLLPRALAGKRLTGSSRATPWTSSPTATRCRPCCWHESTASAIRKTFPRARS